MEACGNYQLWRENGIETITWAVNFDLSTDSALDALDRSNVWVDKDCIGDVSNSCRSK